VHLRFLMPLEPGLKEIIGRFKQSMTVEINYSDEPGEEANGHRRYAQLAYHLRAQLLEDIDCWSRVPGVPLSPAIIEAELRRRLERSTS
jgi:2-oxoglutarate ferredoxin oxidoreductase subunit alpha